MHDRRIWIGVWYTLLVFCCGCGGEGAGSRGHRSQEQNGAPAVIGGPADTLVLDELLNDGVRFLMRGSGESVAVCMDKARTLAMASLAVTQEAERSPVRRRLGNILGISAEQALFAGDQLGAIGIYREAIHNAEAEGDSAGLLLHFYGIGRSFSHTGDHRTALQWLDSAETLQRFMNEDARIMFDVARAFALWGVGDEEQALKLAYGLRIHSSAGASFDRSELTRFFVEVHLKNGRLDSAEHYLGVARRGLAEHPELPPNGTVQMCSAELSLLRGRPAEALLSLDSCVALGGAIAPYGDAVKVLQLYALAYAATGRVQEALTATARGEAALLSGLSLERVRRMATEHTELLHEKERRLVDAELLVRERSRQVAWAIVGGASALVALLAWAMVRGRRAKRSLERVNAELRSTQARLLKAEGERVIAEVRASIARDVHDDLGAELTKVALLSDEASASGSSGSDRKAALRSLGEHARRVKGSVRDIIWSTNPAMDDAGAFVDHLQRTLADLMHGSSAALHVQATTADPEQRLQPEERRHLLLMAKEAVHNAVKHAEATAIFVVLHIDADRFNMRVTDDGVGLSSHGNGGHGLENMRSRAERLSGTLSVGSTNGKGTVVEASGLLSSI